MIHVCGVSHVSRDSLDRIEEALENHEPEIVALELDRLRLEALVGEERGRSGSIFVRLLEKFQRAVGSRTGIMPGSEMVYGYRRAVEEGKEVALIDRDIRVTLGKLDQVPRKEKVKAAVSLFKAFLVSGEFDVSEIPGEDKVKSLLEEFSRKFPELHRVLVEERNAYMAENLRQLEMDRPESDILAVVGAGHKKALEGMVKN